MKSLARIRKRNGRCYELAARAMLYEPDSDQFTLVHGSAAHPDHGGRRLNHAWIELDDGRTIYEPVTDSRQPAAYLAATYQLLVDHRYSRQEACALMSATRNYGPWTEAERAAEKKQ